MELKVIETCWDGDLRLSSNMLDKQCFWKDIQCTDLVGSHNDHERPYEWVSYQQVGWIELEVIVTRWKNSWMGLKAIATSWTAILVMFEAIYM